MREVTTKFCCWEGVWKNSHLKKSSHDLKHSGHVWFDKFSKAVPKFGLKKSKCDHSVFYRVTIAINFFFVYVNDIVISGDYYVGISSQSNTLSDFKFTNYDFDLDIFLIIRKINKDSAFLWWYGKQQINNYMCYFYVFFKIILKSLNPFPLKIFFSSPPPFYFPQKRFHSTRLCFFSFWISLNFDSLYLMHVYFF